MAWVEQECEYYKITTSKNGKKIDEWYTKICDPQWDYISLEEIFYDTWGIEEVHIDYDRSTFPCYCGDAWGHWGADGYKGNELIKGDAWGCCAYMHAYLEDSKGNEYRIDVEPVSEKEYISKEE